MTVLLFGKTGKFLLYHVEHSVIDRAVSNQMPKNWINAKTSPYSKADVNEIYKLMINDCLKYVPDLMNAKCTGFLHGPRMVLKNKGNTDARPSIIDDREKGYITVFSGKIDHSIWVADDILELVESYDR